MKKITKYVAVFALLLVTAVSTVSAYNYKFSFDMNTGLFHGSVDSAYAYKVTANENPVLKINHIESGATVKFYVVNSDGGRRTNVITKKSTYSGAFSNHTTSKGYKYKLRAQTDSGNFYNRYNVTGGWNIDSY